MTVSHLESNSRESLAEVESSGSEYRYAHSGLFASKASRESLPWYSRGVVLYDYAAPYYLFQ